MDINHETASKRPSYATYFTGEKILTDEQIAYLHTLIACEDPRTHLPYLRGGNTPSSEANIPKQITLCYHSSATYQISVDQEEANLCYPLKSRHGLKNENWECHHGCHIRPYILLHHPPVTIPILRESQSNTVKFYIA